MNEGAKQANEDVWRRQMLAELQAIKNALQKEEPKPNSLQQLKAEIAALVDEHSHGSKFCGGNYQLLVNKLRQLSAV